MDGRAREPRVASHASSLIAVLGATVAAVAVANFLSAVTTVGVGIFPVLALVLCLSLAVGLLCLSRWLRRSDFGARDSWTVVRWCLGGMVGFAALSSLSIGIRLAEGRIVGGAVLEVLVTGAGGGIGGGVAGVYYARATRAAREADHRRDALVFLNSHLRHNVLNATQVIRGYSALLAQQVDDAGEYLDPIERRSDTISSLIEDMKQLADIFSGKHEPTPTDISTVLLQEVQTVSAAHEEATVEVDVPPELYVMATSAVSAVFANLLRNAVEHHDSASPTVSVSIEETERTVSVHIVDDGPGIRDDVKTYLFESGVESGEGRGIALVKTLMNHYGGEVDVRDNEPRGTEVIVRFWRPPPGMDGQYN